MFSILGLFELAEPLVFSKFGGGARLLFIGTLAPTLFPTIFFETEFDLCYDFTPTCLPPNEFFLTFVSYFWMGCFLGGASSVIPYYFCASSLFLAMSSASSSLLIIIRMAFLFCLGSINYFAFMSYFVPLYWGFLSYFTRSAYLSVFRVFSDDADEGEMFPIITVLQNPTKESLRTIVSLDPRKGVCPFPWSSARMHSFKESSDLLIYAPSILVCLSISMWSAPLSFPAKSIKEIFPWSFFPSFIEIWRIACDLEESAFAEFCDVTLCILPKVRYSMNYSLDETFASSKPIILMLFLLSSLNFSSVLLLSKSKSFPQ